MCAVRVCRVEERGDMGFGPEARRQTGWGRREVGSAGLGFRLGDHRGRDLSSKMDERGMANGWVMRTATWRIRIRAGRDCRMGMGSS